MREEFANQVLELKKQWEDGAKILEVATIAILEETCANSRKIAKLAKDSQGCLNEGMNLLPEFESLTDEHAATSCCSKILAYNSDVEHIRHDNAITIKKRENVYKETYGTVDLFKERIAEFKDKMFKWIQNTDNLKKVTDALHAQFS
ncbi:MAG: hypothetical protein LBR91_02780 [Puniceicoccales bacterium]|nr:hypothetical protein [Puniceicoccales bacterium]